MNLFWYRLLLFLAYPLVAYTGWKRCQKYQETETEIENCFASRFGRNPKKFKQGGIWIHAVSVGETRSIFPLLKALKKKYPDLPLTVTSGSTQGALQALKFCPVEIQHQMMPYDYRSAVKRFLIQIQPKLVIMIETEIWPNLYHACSDKNIPLVLANARLKEKSFNAYLKWAPKLIASTLNQTQFVATQFETDSQRMELLGVTTNKIKTLGNLKFDIEIPQDLIPSTAQWRANNNLNQRFIWVAASTHKDEETLMINAHKLLMREHPDALLILVPRHADRFSEVSKLCKDSSFNCSIRSENSPITKQTQLYLADTIGELMFWFAASDAAFIGGSLVPFGGHNILEPAALTKPVLSGQYHMNLQALYDSFKEDNAIFIADNDTELAQQLIKLADSPEFQKQMGQKAYYCFKKQSGALNRLMDEITPFLIAKDS